MKHLELHIIQSIPVSCLNRDDLGSPKTAVFGGAQRARVSSQSWKRAIRERASELDVSHQFKGQRSRLFIQKIKEELIVLGEEAPTSQALSLCVGHYLANLDPKEMDQVKTLMFFSPLEYRLFAEALFSLSSDDKNKLMTAIESFDASTFSDDDSEEETEMSEDIGNKKAKGKKAEKNKITAKKLTELVNNILKKPLREKRKEADFLPKDAADIALFGRMVANDASLTLEAATMFSHALSVHKVDNEIDFFAAVDDLQPDSEVGSGHLGTLEFNSATYYRFAAVNLDMLADAAHLGAMTLEERKSVVKTFVKATIEAVPGARRATMNSNTMPIRVLGVVRDTGHPIQLINAFEKPLYSKDGYTEKAKAALNEEYKTLKDTWGVSAVFEKAIPDVSLKVFLDEILTHVV